MEVEGEEGTPICISMQKKVFYDSGRVLWRAQLWGSLSCISQMVSVWIILRWSRREKYINIPSEKYIYVRIYVYICVFT